MPDSRQAVRRVIELCRGLLAELELLESIEDRSERQGASWQIPNPQSQIPNPQSQGSELSHAGAGAARGSEPSAAVALSDRIGTRIAFDRSNERIDSFVRERERPFKGLSLSIDSIGAFEENDVRCEAVRFLAERIQRALHPPLGRRWRDDRRLIITAAVLAVRLDAISPDGQTGQRWLQAALDSVEQFQPKKVMAYFQRCLQMGLLDIDPQITDKATAIMVWMRLTRRIPIPEAWLVEPKGEARRQNEEGRMKKAEC